ncbi:MAG: histidine--tRNA ligase [Ignavibacteriales bacterium]|nr:histidine--tRNA ligase [Ignavibacteriales bacterium]
MSTENQNIIEPRTVKGMRDYLPETVIARRKIIETVRTVFERYGFVPLDTPALEYVETLVGHGDTSKNIFRSKSPEEEDIALRFDLTVPLARVVSQYEHLPKPFRRYQVANVWRADKPDPGRFREFIQFDLDTVGSSSMSADTEILCGMYDVFVALGIKNFLIRFSSRKLLDALLLFAEIPNELSKNVFRILDKLDKISFNEVALELTVGRTDISGDKIKGLGLKNEQVNKIKQFLDLPKATRLDSLANVEQLFASAIPSANDGISELKEICNYLNALNIPEEKIQIDFSLARGLDYYTGPVFEAILLDAPEFGSVFGGGRYDGLVQRFLGKNIPAVGASTGIDRLLAALEKLQLIESTPSTAQVIVTVMERNRMSDYMQLTRELRENGINTELYLGEEKGLGKQLQYANKQQIPLAVIIGSNEFEKDEVTIKDLRAGKNVDASNREEYMKATKQAQITFPKTELINTIYKMLS